MKQSITGETIHHFREHTMRINRFSAAVIAGTMLTGCQTLQDNPKQVGGTLLGAGLGALAGSQMGSGKGQAAAIALGTLAGAWIGNEIGKSLDAADQASFTKESAQALSSAQDGQPVFWNNPDSGASATMVASNTRRESRQVTVVRDKRMVWAPDIELMGEPYRVVTNANLRQGPSTQTNVIGGLKAGETFKAVGRVSSGDWIVVGKNDRSIGYVYAPLVAPALNEDTGGIDLDAPELRQAINLDEINLDDDSMVAETVSAETECRTLDYTINTSDGKSRNESFNACRGSDGAWEIM